MPNFVLDFYIMFDLLETFYHVSCLEFFLYQLIRLPFLPMTGTFGLRHEFGPIAFPVS